LLVAPHRLAAETRSLRNQIEAPGVDPDKMEDPDDIIILHPRLQAIRDRAAPIQGP
jgi:hypothetical protein